MPQAKNDASISAQVTIIKGTTSLASGFVIPKSDRRYPVQVTSDETGVKVTGLATPFWFGQNRRYLPDDLFTERVFTLHCRSGERVKARFHALV